MKKLILALGALILAAPVQALFESQFRDNALEVVYTSPAVTSSTAAIIVDLSDTTNWPHKQTGSVNLSSIRVDFDKAGASTSTVKVGVVTAVGSSSGTVKWFYVAASTANHVSTPGPDNASFAGVIRTATSGGATPYILTNNTSTNSTMFQTDVLLPTANASFGYPAVGDIVGFIEGGGVAASLTATIHLVYIAER